MIMLTIVSWLSLTYVRRSYIRPLKKSLWGAHRGVIFYPYTLNIGYIYSATLLNTKFSEEGVVDTKVSIAPNLLLLTETGSEFVYHLLMLKQPKLASTSLTTIDIPTYTYSKSDLYVYAKAVRTCIYVQEVNQQIYTDKKYAFIYLSHLDLDEYKNKIVHLCTVIKTKLDTIPIKYRVPGIATMLAQKYGHTPVNATYVNTLNDNNMNDNSNNDSYIQVNYTGNKPTKNNCRQCFQQRTHCLPLKCTNQLSK